MMMELELIRTYHPEGTNGVILYNQLPVCYSIELPWKENKVKQSCIPEGRYEVVKRYSLKFSRHLHLKGIKGRSLILMHPANDALQELKGCIAPVLHLTGEGRGSYSRLALSKLFTIVENAFKEKQAIYLTIKSNPDEKTKTQNSIAHPKVF
jgi:hypothetical protein